jgi:NADPH2:quinone reductase
MPKAVQLSAYGGIEQLAIVDVPKPESSQGDVVVRVLAAGTNPGEISIREGLLKDMYPKAFPFGQGTDFAGWVDSVGPGVTEFEPGDEVIGWSEERSAHADYVCTTPAQPSPRATWWRSAARRAASARSRCNSHGGRAPE